MVRIKYYILIILCLILVFSSCTKIKDLISPPTPRELYQREFEENDERFNLWTEAYQRSLEDRISTKLPYSETGSFSSERMEVYSYNIELNQGELFHLDMIVDSSDTRVFIDFYKVTNDTLTNDELIIQNEPFDRYFQFNVEESGMYKVVIQPEIMVQSGFSFSLYTLPSLGFPVAGKGNSDIQSFWGASRDAGVRSHEGIDIFAPRGTPVVAATDGYVRSTGERGLGGKQVWLRTGLFGNSLYYAHLDSITVSRTARVSRGDTLGFVGNTGNAITTSPHLHFGIYSNRGAVDPLPFVFQREPYPAIPTHELESSELIVQSQLANLRLKASTEGEQIGQAVQGDTLQLMGITNNWRHVQTSNGLRAYIHESLVEYL